MAKAFSIASWNVEHFKNGAAARVDRIVDFLKTQKPDVFAIYEVEGKEVFSSLVAKMAGYQSHITEGPQTQEILVGVKSGLTAFFTQKLTFKSGNTYLRPGALLTVTVSGKNYSMLFLHTKSSNAPVGLGLRDDMFRRAFEFRKTLDKASAAAGAGGKANFIFMGDLNTMGMKYPFQKKIDAPLELQKLDSDAAKVKMRRLAKSCPATWSNGSQSSLKPSDLDHVVAADHLKFKKFTGAEVDCRGWTSLATTPEQDKWIKDFSDHALLYMELQKV
ncbi:MAG TPA: endonuclease/exonuclease/phosphatase family protein [Candidatus Acidoferrales bacterium]